MQPMVVLMAGMALGPRLGMASQILYLAAGIAGLPVFAASATLPPGAALQTLDGERLKDWWRAGDSVELRFAGNALEVTTSDGVRSRRSSIIAR